jgi:ATP adenylyltransferase
LSSYYCLANHRDPEQRDEMVRLDHADVCLFCAPAYASDDSHPILWQSASWSVTPNRYPYAGTTLHLLLIPAQHVVDVLDLPRRALGEIWDALAWIKEYYSLSFYGLALRSGDCRYTGGTIKHLHFHVIVGDVENPEHAPVRLKLSSRPPEGSAEPGDSTFEAGES